MNEILDSIKGLLGPEILWGVPAWRLVAAVLIIFLGFFSRRLVTWLFGGFLKRRVGKTRVQWDDDLVRLVPRPLALVIQIVLWQLAAAILLLPEEPLNIRRFVTDGLNAAIAVALVWVFFRLTDVLALALERAAQRTETRLDDQAVPLLRKTIKVFVGIVVAVMVIQNLGYSVTSLIASLGIGGLALALAAKDTVANFFGSVVIFTDAPFQIGDWVEFDGVEGTVEEVGFRTTRIRKFDKGLVTVPNQTFTSTAITNYSNRKIRRIKLTVGVSYETSAEEMERLLEALRLMIAEHPGIGKDFYLVHFTNFGASSLDILIYCFTTTAEWTTFLEIQEDVMLRIMRIIAAHGLEIAYPTRTVYLRDEHWPGGPEDARPPTA
ncbi:mechanosensitive ion channel family protein [Rhodocaloribacter sp.]